jgi:uncharacterized protein YbaA (DUF1428 family)
MYSSIYIYCVAVERVAAFLRVQQAALTIYREYGAIDDATYAPTDLTAQYGSVGFTDIIAVAANEQIYISVSSFRDRAHHDQVMAQVDADPRIDQLYQEMLGIIDISRMVRGEFQRVV